MVPTQGTPAVQTLCMRYHIGLREPGHGFGSLRARSCALVLAEQQTPYEPSLNAPGTPTREEKNEGLRAREEKNFLITHSEPKASAIPSVRTCV